ncbi:MAG: ATP synthase subunit C [Spirochaetaceae bacterium]|jgi:V/A-type H+-transporting ATPase subunit K|nr:ATP synthase subunit C [Spirochaetaceae bacterium]
MKRLVVFFVLVLLVFGAAAGFAQEAAAEAASTGGNTSMWKYFAAALAVGVSCIAGGIAVGQIGSAAMGAMSENPELSGKALPYAGLAEGICLWGFLVALLIIIF